MADQPEDKVLNRDGFCAVDIVLRASISDISSQPHGALFKIKIADSKSADEVKIKE